MLQLNLADELACLKQAYQDAKDAYEVALLLHTSAIANGERGTLSTVNRLESAYHASAHRLAMAVCEVKS